MRRDGYEAAQEIDPPPLWWAAFMPGLGLLWHGNLDEAEAMLEQSLQEAIEQAQGLTPGV